jgi:hypothetical protein
LTLRSRPLIARANFNISSGDSSSNAETHSPGTKPIVLSTAAVAVADRGN